MQKESKSFRMRGHLRPLPECDFPLGCQRWWDAVPPALLLSCHIIPSPRFFLLSFLPSKLLAPSIWLTTGTTISYLSPQISHLTISTALSFALDIKVFIITLFLDIHDFVNRSKSLKNISTTVFQHIRLLLT